MARRRVRESLFDRTQRPVPLEEVAQRAARRELHRQEPVTVGVADVEDAADVRMANRAAEAQLAREPFRPALDRASSSGFSTLTATTVCADAIERAQHDAAAAPSR